MKEITLIEREARLVFRMLDSGMPISKKERDGLAKIWVKLRKFLKK